MNPVFKTLLIALLGTALIGTGCSIKKLAVNRLGDSLSGGGATFASDDDPELVKAAVPFSLKLVESLLAESPKHEGLLAAAASGFTQYAYAFVQEDADEIRDNDLTAATKLDARARKLYLRARDYGLRGLEARHEGFAARLRKEPKPAVLQATRKDVPMLYWTAVAWAGAISLSKDNPDLIAELPLVEAMIDRALALDEKFEDGAIHTFLISYEMSRQGVSGDPAVRSRKHFDRAMALTGGQQAAPLVSFAEAVSVQKQDVGQFDTLLQRACSINVDARPSWRLANLVMQRRANWLLSRKDELFLSKPAPDSKPSP